MVIVLKHEGTSDTRKYDERSVDRVGHRATGPSSCRGGGTRAGARGGSRGVAARRGGASGDTSAGEVASERTRRSGSLSTRTAEVGCGYAGRDGAVGSGSLSSGLEGTEGGAGGRGVDGANHSSEAVRSASKGSSYTLGTVEPNRLSGIGDGEVPGGEGGSRAGRNENETRVEASINGLAGFGETGLGDGVVTGGASEVEGDDGAFRGSDVIGNELEDTTGSSALCANLDHLILGRYNGGQGQSKGSSDSTHFFRRGVRG